MAKPDIRYCFPSLRAKRPGATLKPWPEFVEGLFGGGEKSFVIASEAKPSAAISTLNLEDPASI